MPTPCVSDGLRHNCPLKAIPLLPCVAGVLRCVGARVPGSCTRVCQLSALVYIFTLAQASPHPPTIHLLLCLITRSEIFEFVDQFNVCSVASGPCAVLKVYLSRRGCHSSFPCVWELSEANDSFLIVLLQDLLTHSHNLHNISLGTFLANV